MKFLREQQIWFHTFGKKISISYYTALITHSRSKQKQILNNNSFVYYEERKKSVMIALTLITEVNVALFY